MKFFYTFHVVHPTFLCCRVHIYGPNASFICPIKTLKNSDRLARSMREGYALLVDSLLIKRVFFNSHQERKNERDLVSPLMHKIPIPPVSDSHKRVCSERIEVKEITERGLFGLHYHSKCGHFWPSGRLEIFHEKK